MTDTSEWFVNCPRGLEAMLAEELAELGGEQIRETVAGVYVVGPLAFAYRTCLWSRLANRVLMPLVRAKITDADSLYATATSVDWPAHMSGSDTLAVDFVGSSEEIRHTRFGAQRVKDAIVDSLLKITGQRPEVDLRNPEIRVNAHLAKDTLVLSLDVSGRSLHRRGYRQAMVPAPLKENLAAALLLRAGWRGISQRSGALIDPLCGSGTLLIEAAMMAADIAPGLLCPDFCFRNWKQHDDSQWQALLAEARERRTQGLNRALPEIRGYDKDSRAVAAAQENIEAIGLQQVVRVMAKPLQALKQPTHTRLESGLLICNPPYGERWGDEEELRPLYQSLGQVAKNEFPGWQLAVFTGNPRLAQELRLRSDKRYKLFNGTIPAQLLLYSLRTADEQLSHQQLTEQSGNPESPAGAVTGLQELSAGATSFANRLQKNQRKMQSWLKRANVSNYRLYDNDIPEYAVAVDIYQPLPEGSAPALHVQEYAAPASIGEQAARTHLGEIREALHSLYPDSRERIYFKERRRQRGTRQYERLSPWGRSGNSLTVLEGRARFEVNLGDYLDTGLFLDHRPVRQLLAETAGGKRFLNLFCYTATATVQAALGGAASSLSIDMSNTYLEWAERNFNLNAIDRKRHLLLRADCLQWLATSRDTFDLILLDPPTFSNSKAMESVLDIQRDHPKLIDQAMARLAPQGTLIFSNNFRRFSLDPTIARRFRVEDISRQSIPEDFARNSRIHQCWLIRH